MAATALSRPVYSEFWIRPDVNEEYTLDDKILYIYLITNRHFQQHAIYQLTKKMMMTELNMPEDRFNVAFDRLENKFGVIKYSDKSNEIAILDYLKYGVISKGSALTKLYDNLGKKVDDMELLKDMYFYSLGILDNRQEVLYAKKKMRELLNNQDMLNDYYFYEGAYYYVGMAYPENSMRHFNFGHFDKEGVFYKNPDVGNGLEEKEEQEEESVKRYDDDDDDDDDELPF